MKKNTYYMQTDSHTANYTVVFETLHEAVESCKEDAAEYGEDAAEEYIIYQFETVAPLEEAAGYTYRDIAATAMYDGEGNKIEE